MAANNWDWVFHTLGWTLAGLGLLLALWALFWDRSRGRKRCPKCWYSMVGAVESEGGSLTCPECGRNLNNRKTLLRTRRRWRQALLAILICMLGYGSHLTSAVNRYGWIAAVPTTVLVLTVPPDNFMALPSGTIVPVSSPALELLRRYVRHDVLSWQADLFAWRFHLAGKKAHDALELKSYDISDFTRAKDPHFSSPPSSLTRLFGRLPSRSDGKLVRNYNATAYDIADIIQSNVAFEDWIVNGGRRASLSIVQDRFLVSASPELHEQIEGLLMQLRGVAPASPR